MQLVRLTNFLKLEVKPLRQIQKNVMQRLDINPSSFSLQMVRSDTTIIPSWISLVAFFLFSRQIFLIILSALGVFLRLEGGLLRPNSSPVSILFFTCITDWLLTNCLLSKFNMAGGKGKEKFKGTNIRERFVN
ncbi:uncharacterized protein LOC136097001 isoform X2 [Hydra vulgaris]|uniref:uncharacterized protein LOC136097001 isoform X2 n=1 Tax=Hydra vulgaris TaxID=6087 RepID=UPI0032EA77C8